MRSLASGIGLSLLLAAGLGSSLGFAQDREEFKARMAEAASVMKTDVSEALRMYLEIRTVFAGAEVDYSLGRAYQRLGQCENAKFYYTQVMVAYELSETSAIYQRAVSAFDEISSCDAWQKVNLKCEIPVDGYVMVDNERLSSCWDRPFSMSDGEHTFKVVAPDGRENVKTLSFQSGNAPQNLSLFIEPEIVEVDKTVEIEKQVEVRERFHPGLYWGLIAGGVAVVGIGGIFGALANDARVDEQKWADYMGVYGTSPDKYNDYKKKRDSAHDDVKRNHALMYSFIGVGAAVAATGVALAIVSAVSDKAAVENDTVSTYVMPNRDGVFMGIRWQF